MILKELSLLGVLILLLVLDELPPSEFLTAALLKKQKQFSQAKKCFVISKYKSLRFANRLRAKRELRTYMDLDHWEGIEQRYPAPLDLKYAFLASAIWDKWLQPSQFQKLSYAHAAKPFKQREDISHSFWSQCFLGQQIMTELFNRKRVYRLDKIPTDSWFDMLINNGAILHIWRFFHLGSI